MIKQVRSRTLFYRISDWGCAPVQWSKETLKHRGKPRLGEMQSPPLEQDKRCKATSSKMSPKGRCKIRIERSENLSYISCMEDDENEGTLGGAMQNVFKWIKQALSERNSSVKHSNCDEIWA